jgi:ribosome-binding protein aMBF1 (putative translation factor)
MKTKDGLKLIERRFAKTPRLKRMLAEERVNLQAALLLRKAREEAGVTQAELAERVGTTQSVISRLEDADYAGHTLKILERILNALGQHVVLGAEPVGAA